MKSIQELKARRLIARKQKDDVASKALATLIAELEYEQEKGKVIDASVITGKIRKYMETALNNADLSVTVQDKVKFITEADFFEDLLPDMLTGADILKIMDENCVASVGEGMRILKRQYPGLYDGREASAAIKEYLG